MICWFCEKRSAEDGATIQIFMIRIHPNEKYDEWRDNPRYVEVPRCSICKFAHGKAKLFTYGGGATGGLGGIALCISIILDTSDWLLGFGSIGMFTAMGVGIGISISKAYVLKGIRPEWDKKKFRTVKEMVKNGWEICDEDIYWISRLHG